jgi:hypothetical protein
MRTLGSKVIALQRSSNVRMQRFCKEAVKRVLIASSVAGTAGAGLGCRGSDATLQQPRAQRLEDTSARAVSSSRPVFATDAETHGRTAGALPPAIAPTMQSTTWFAAFPCRPGAREEPLPQGGPDPAVYIAQEAERSRKDLDFRGRALALHETPDFVEVVRTGPARWMVEGGNPIASSSPLLRMGSMCSGARDPNRCAHDVQRKRAALVPKDSCRGLKCPDGSFLYALTTLGDHVRIYRSEAELIQLLGTIDTPMEAWLLVAAKHPGTLPVCEAPEFAMHRKVPEGYELKLRILTSRCKPLLEENFLYMVTHEGTLSQISRVDALRQPDHCIISGRRPAGLIATTENEPRCPGEMFARMAYLEAASVTAFEVLTTELRELGADDDLLCRLENARQDEIRHAEIMAQWAARFGHAPAHAAVVPQGRRSPFAIALENVTEGCVRELFGALVVRFQAASARDPSLRADLAGIADDEASHAALSHDLDTWLRARLSFAERAQLDAARRGALAKLADSLAEPTGEQRELCGLPSLAQSRSLLKHMADFEAAPSI